MADPFEHLNWEFPVKHRRRDDGGYADQTVGNRGAWLIPTETGVDIKAHIIIGPYEENQRTNDHILSGRAKQVGLVVERGAMVMWTSADVRKGDRVEVYMDATGTEKKMWLVVDERGRPTLITKLTGYRPGRRELKCQAETP